MRLLACVLALAPAACGRLHFDEGGDLPVFQPPQRIPELFEPDVELDDPSLRADLREMYFTRNATGVNEIWRVLRPDATAPWGTPAPVAELAMLGDASNAELSRDGLVLYLSASGDLWRTTRATFDDPWQPPVRVAELATTASEFGTTFSSDELDVVFDSNRLGSQDLFEARRSSPDLPFAAPARLEVLTTPRVEQDPFLDHTGHLLLFASVREDSLDLWASSRTDASGAFTEPVPVAGTSVPLASDKDPWLSDDGTLLVFASDRDGVLSLYTATAP